MKHHRTRVSRARPEVIRYLRGGMEAVVLALAALSPWAFGGVDPVFELALTAGLVVLLVLWAVVAVHTGRFSWVRCRVAAGLAGIFLLGVVQLVPLPHWLLGLASPGTARFYAALSPGGPEHPGRAEQLTATETAAVPDLTHGVSVYPHATRAELFRWLGVILLFAVVRNQIASTASLKRLALVVTINGALLAVLGIAQTFSSPPGTIYWKYLTQGQVFGPFVNRNHFAGYLNVCIALGIGLLLLTGPSELDRRRTIIRKPYAPQEQAEEEGVVFSPLGVLHSPAQLWICTALALMLAGLVCSLSRGGVAALLLALAASIGLRLLVGRRIRVRRLEYVVLPVVLVLALLAWLNVRPLETRLGNVFRGDPIEDDRLQLWSHLLRLVPSFPVFGSGYGTLSYVEPTTRVQGVYMTSASVADSNVVIEHAHNDYLEALVEGGVLRFGLTLLVVGLVFKQGFRALRRFAGRTPGAYAYAGLLAFLTVALHAAVDFSLSTPAVAILAAIVIAQLVALNRSDPTEPISAAHHRVVTVRLPPLGQVGAVAVALLLGAVLLLYAWRADQVHRLRVGAYLAVRPPSRNQSSDRGRPADYDRALAYLEAAVHTDPDDADLQLELGQVLLDARQDHVRQWRESLRPAQRNLAALAVSAADAPAAAAAVLASHDLERVPPARERELFQKFVVPGLQHMALARRSCPLLPRPHIRFAAYAADLVRADPPAAYWARARLLAPFDADLWYFSGVQQLRDGQPEEARQSWRRSLELSGRHLDDIIDLAVQDLAGDPRRQVQRLTAEVLPDDPELYLRTVEHLDPDADAQGALRPLLERGLALVTGRSEALTAREYYLEARFHQYLGQFADALRDFDQALTIAEAYPTPRLLTVIPTWRRQYIGLLLGQEKWKEALRELEILKRQQPYPQIEKDIERVKQKLGLGV